MTNIKKSEKHFYGFQHSDGTATTTGEPNRGFERFNGRYSIAGNAICFKSLAERKKWLSEYCSSRGGRVAVSRAELRRLLSGYTNSDFAEYIEQLHF
jgi:hypothetical protein